MRYSTGNLVECYRRDGRSIKSPMLLKEIYSVSFRTFSSLMERMTMQAAISICSKLSIPIPYGFISEEKRKALIGYEEVIDRNVSLKLLLTMAIINLDLEPIFLCAISAWGFRIWILCVGLFIYSVFADWLNKPVVYKFSHSQNIWDHRHGILNRYSNDIQQSQWSSDISISQCEFSILQVKLLYMDDPTSEGTATLEYGSLVQFQIIIRYNSQRFDFWH